MVREATQFMLCLSRVDCSVCHLTVTRSQTCDALNGYHEKVIIKMTHIS